MLLKDQNSEKRSMTNEENIMKENNLKCSSEQQTEFSIPIIQFTRIHSLEEDKSR